VNAGRLTLARFVDLTSAGPARIFQIARKGRIAEGYDADFTIVDMKARRTITNGWIESRCKWTAHDGRTVTGGPVRAMVRGRLAMWNGEITGLAHGQPIRFTEAL
jgi:dihydroorotase